MFPLEKLNQGDSRHEAQRKARVMFHIVNRRCLHILPFPKGGCERKGRKKVPDSFNCAAKHSNKLVMKLLEGVGRLHHMFLEN